MVVAVSGKLFLGFLLGLAVGSGGGFAYLKIGTLPVAVTDEGVSLEKEIVKVADAVAHRAREEGALRLAPAKMSSRAARMSTERNAQAAMEFPVTTWPMRSICIPQRRSFGRSHAQGNVVGVSDDEAGETYWKVANGIRLTGMPCLIKGALRTPRCGR